MKYSISILVVLFITSCSTYIDKTENNINNESMIFNYGLNENKLIFISKINASADGHIFYNTHFELSLPKKMLNWSRKSNEFFFEYDNKQIIYLYIPYKNEEKESAKWEMKDIDYHDALNLGEYWEERKYEENYLYKEHTKRISKIYTNGKYIIMLYNIKDINYPQFVQNVKTFKLIQ